MSMSGVVHGLSDFELRPEEIRSHKDSYSVDHKYMSKTSWGFFSLAKNINPPGDAVRREVWESGGFVLECLWNIRHAAYYIQYINI